MRSICAADDNDEMEIFMKSYGFIVQVLGLIYMLFVAIASFDSSPSFAAFTPDRISINVIPGVIVIVLGFFLKGKKRKE